MPYVQHDTASIPPHPRRGGIVVVHKVRDRYQLRLHRQQRPRRRLRARGRCHSAVRCPAEGGSGEGRTNTNFANIEDFWNVEADD